MIDLRPVRYPGHTEGYTMLVSPSILTCDFAHAGEVLALAKGCGADMLHLDVMDGVFVPNLSFGPPVIAALRPHSTLPFDVHLMMQYPDRLLEAFAKAADGQATKIIIPSDIQGLAGMVKAVTEVAKES